jgi:hypothetical protein
MAIYTASAAQANIVPKGLRVGLVAVTGQWSFPASISIGTQVQMVKVPANATPVYVTLLNTNAGQASMSVGDDLDNARYRTNFTTSAAMGAVPINAQYIPYTYSTDDTIDVFVSLVSVTTLGGALYLTAIFSMDPEAH